MAGLASNVRELRLTLESAAARAGNNAIAPRHLPIDQNADGARDTTPLPTLEDVERYRADPEHRRFADEVLAPRIDVKKI